MFRIKTTLNGKYIVEVKHKYFFGLFTKWKPYVKASGLDTAQDHDDRARTTSRFETSRS